jgi:hypothetical protein
MQNSPAIGDALVFALSRLNNKLTLLDEDSHLLRRFGQLDVLDLSADSETEFEVRAEADRFIFPIAGSLRARLIDLRQGSPSEGTRTEIELTAQNPSGLLSPFGVALSLRAETDARVIILSTHGRAHSEDRILAADELGRFSAVQ